jgi:hypothetical protein
VACTKILELWYVECIQIVNRPVSSGQESAFHEDPRPKQVDANGLFVAWFYTTLVFPYPLCEESLNIERKIGMKY